MESEMKCNVSEKWSPMMPKGLDFEVSHHPLTMRQVVNLIIAMERFKDSSSESVMSTEFRDEHLLDMMLDSVVEERIVFECESAPPSDQITRIRELEYSVTDEEKRSLVQVQNSMELHAVTLQAGSETTKVHLNMSTYRHPQPSVAGRTVALGIKDTDLYLSCQKEGDQPTLHLETVDKANLSAISPDSDMVRFLFYKQVTGVNLSTLMSVAFRDWYISTAEQDNNPVDMCQESAPRYRLFNMTATGGQA